MKQVRLNRVSPRRMLRKLLTFGGGAATFLREVPMDIRRVLAQTKGGKSKITFNHAGLEPATNVFERSTNRLSFALVVAVLIIGSKVPPMRGDVSVVGIVGYLLAGLMGF